jgi:hypothetical protein
MSESIAPVTVVEGANYPGSETIGPVTIVGDTVIGAGASVDSKDVQVLAGNVTAIDIVANNIDSVLTDANNISSINTVAAVSQQVAAVSNNITAVSAVAPKLNEVNRYYTTYLGASATPPTVRLDGTPLQSGDMYLSTASGSAGTYVRNLGVWYILSSANFVQQTQIDLKLSKSGDSMTGNIGMNLNKVTGLGAPTNNEDAVTKLYVDNALALKFDKAGGSMTGALAMSNSKITGLGNPTNAEDATNKNYVDTGLGLKVSTSGGTMTGILNMGVNKITNLSSPTNVADATNKNYVDFFLGLKVFKGGDTMTGNLDMSSKNITRLGAPSADTDATNKSYVDEQNSFRVSKFGDSMTGALAMGGFRITDLPSPINAGDASNKSYVDQAIAQVNLGGGTGTTTPFNFTGAGKVVLQNNPQMTGTIAAESQTLSGTLAVTGGITGGLTGNVTGNASTATTLATGRTIGMTGDVTYTSASFDGSGNVTGTATLANTTVTPGTYGATYTGPSTINQIPIITVDAKGRVTSLSHHAVYSVPNADYAQVLSVGRTIEMTGDVTYTSAAFNGSANVTGTATLANSGVAAGVYGSTSAIPTITVDSKGRVTSVSTNALAAPSTLATGRTIGMTGDVTYTSAAFNGSANVTGTATLANSGVVAGIYGSSTIIPTIHVDAKGRVTNVTNNTLPQTAGATGGGTDRIFWENDRTVTTNYDIGFNKNAMTAGPLTINNGVTVTIPTGGVWTVV